MSWIKTEIKLEDIPGIKTQGMAMIKMGNPLVEQLRCVFTLKDDPIYYAYPLVDYVDFSTENEFTSFYIYQLQAEKTQ